jgi:hypothetical protein
MKNSMLLLNRDAGQYRCLHCGRDFELKIFLSEWMFCPVCGNDFPSIVDAQAERKKRRSYRTRPSNTARMPSRWIIQTQDLSGGWHTCGKRIDSGAILVDGAEGRALVLERVHWHREVQTGWAAHYSAIRATIVAGDKLPLP